MQLYLWRVDLTNGIRLVGFHLSVDIDIDLLANCLPIGNLHLILGETLEVATSGLVRDPTAFLAIWTLGLLIVNESLMLFRSLILSLGTLVPVTLLMSVLNSIYVDYVLVHFFWKSASVSIMWSICTMELLTVRLFLVFHLHLWGDLQPWRGILKYITDI